MFYQRKLDKELRFGDVLKGYVLTSPYIDEPNPQNDFRIDVKLPDFCVVLSPCCSIGEKMISLSPLIKVRNSFFYNPYLKEDLTRVNRKMSPQQAVPPHTWEGLTLEEKQRRLEKKMALAFVELFVYMENERFSEYDVHRKDQEKISTRYHMIDFREIYKLNCEKIVSPKNFPLESKCLQLSINTRSELREKISGYYTRIPEEDLGTEAL